MRFIGTGIYVHQQTFKDLRVGDIFWDADYGSMVWNGKEWVAEDKYCMYLYTINNILIYELLNGVKLIYPCGTIRIIYNSFYGNDQLQMI